MFLSGSQKFASSILGGVLTSAFGFLYGNGIVVVYGMLALVLFIFLDWIAGSRASRKDNTYASKYGIDGVFRTFFMILLPAGGHLLDVLFQLPVPAIFGLLVGGLLIHTIKSMTANVIRAGWGEWVPAWMLERLVSWVQSEIESKTQRAMQRQAERSGDL
jgi:phage-related holin